MIKADDIIKQVFAGGSGGGSGTPGAMMVEYSVDGSNVTSASHTAQQIAEAAAAGTYVFAMVNIDEEIYYYHIQTSYIYHVGIDTYYGANFQYLELSEGGSSVHGHVLSHYNNGTESFDFQ